jgi:hypothetical protein
MRARMRVNRTMNWAVRKQAARTKIIFKYLSVAVLHKLPIA